MGRGHHKPCCPRKILGYSSPCSRIDGVAENDDNILFGELAAETNLELARKVRLLESSLGNIFLWGFTWKVASPRPNCEARQEIYFIL